MPGNRLTDLQMTKYKKLRGKHTQEAAAAKTGITVRQWGLDLRRECRSWTINWWNSPGDYRCR